MPEIVKLANVNLGHPTPIEIAGATFVLLVEPDGVGTVSVSVTEPEEGTGDDAGNQS